MENLSLIGSDTAKQRLHGHLCEQISVQQKNTRKTAITHHLFDHTKQTTFVADYEKVIDNRHSKGSRT